jgi:hypothetical protein
MRNPSQIPEKAAGDSRAAPSAPALRAETPAEAQGRRTLSTAFVMIGADGQLTVELRDGGTILLRDVVMNRKDYCGVQVVDGAAGPGYCGRYGDVVTARPGAR